MEKDINKSNESSNSLENEKSGVFFNSKLLIDKTKRELTPLENINQLNCNPLSRITKIGQRKQMQSTEFSKSKKKIKKFPHVNTHNHFPW